MKVRPLNQKAVKGKIVAVRVDFNVPLEDGKVTETTRIEASIPTLKYLIDHGAKQIHILSHLGRPKGEYDEKMSLAHVVKTLEQFLEHPVEFRSELTPGESLVQLHENVRFHKGEKKNDPEFIKELLNLKAEVFINDGFAVSHRAHASVVGLAHYLPSYPGFLVEKEITHLSPFLSDEKMPGLCLLTGGAKLETKVKILKHFALTAENILIGGAIANTLLVAKGYDVGESLYEEDELETARDILQIAQANNTGIYLPVDVVCAEDIKSDDTQEVQTDEVSGKMKIFDIGKKSIKNYTEVLNHAQTIIWNGPVGCFEFTPFELGTKKLLKVIAAQKSAQTILGGGDTLEAINKFGVDKDAFTHVSTGGGSMLEFLEGKELPGIEVLKSL